MMIKLLPYNSSHRFAGKSVRSIAVASLFAVLLLAASPALCQQATPAASWKFDESSGNTTHDSVGGFNDPILNHHQWVTGALGGGLKFDGFTTVIQRSAEDAPKLGGGFTIEAWVALASYPWNWVAIVDKHPDRHSGYYFGIDAEGRLGLKVAVWGTWQVCRSDIRVPLDRWVHVVGVYDPQSGLHLYINGKAEGSLPVIGDFTPAKNTPLWIGRNQKDLPPVALIRPKASFPAKYSLDGILDDLKIYSQSFSAADVEADYNPRLAAAAPELTPRHWPALPGPATHLKAAYTSLKLYPEWDALWRTGRDSDVVVSFPNLPIHYVFWRGANYGPNLVTGNGIWMSTQSFESHTKIGTAEHMNDKHDLHSWISIVQNNDARVVLHWRYALVDVLGNLAFIDPQTGWGDWVDEYFYIYPDGIAVRHATLHTAYIHNHYSFTEPTLLLAPGTKPEDFISLDAATIANSEGVSRTYSWGHGLPPSPFPNQPAGANIAVINLKSQYKPLYIYRPGMVLGPYGWSPELRLLYSHFPVWDHWPVNQIPSDGRFELYPDHYGSSAILSPDRMNIGRRNMMIHGPDADELTDYYLFGLSDQPISYVAELDRSWLNPPPLKMRAGDFTAVYEQGQRAYVLSRKSAPGDQKAPRRIVFTMEASNHSPVVNPAFVIEGWGTSPVVVRVGGKPALKGAVEQGFIRKLDQTGLVLWLRNWSTKPVEISISTNRGGER